MRRLAALVVLTFVAGCGSGTDEPSVEVTVDLPDRNGSGIFGVADVARLDDERVRIEVSLEGALPDRDLPAYVITGGCETTEPDVSHDLDPVAEGRSSTEVDLPMAEITTGSYAVAVGSKDPMEYVACGDLVP